MKASGFNCDRLLADRQIRKTWRFLLMSAILIVLASVMPGLSYAQDISQKEKEIISKYSCANDQSDPAYLLMVSFLREWNRFSEIQSATWQDDKIDDVHRSGMKLTDFFIAPSYLEKYRIPPGTAPLNMYSANTHERLLCIKHGDTGTQGITILAHRDVNHGWVFVFSYSLVTEGGRIYISPATPPKESSQKAWLDDPKMRQFLQESNQPVAKRILAQSEEVWISPMTEIEKYWVKKP